MENIPPANINAAIIICIASINKILPLAQTISSGAHLPMWYVDFCFDGEFTPDFSSQLEEAMRGLIKKGEEIRRQEMLFSNAIKYCLRYKEAAKVDYLEQFVDQVHPFLLFDNILEKTSGEAPCTTKEAGFIQILSIKKEEGFWRIWGSAFPTKQELKDYKKKFTKLVKVPRPGITISHFGLKAVFPKDDQKIRGAFCKNIQESGVVHLTTPPTFFQEEGDVKYLWHREIYIKSGAKTSYTWEFDQSYDPLEEMMIDNPYATDYPLRDRHFIFGPPVFLQESLISSLQFIRKFINIFDLKCEWYLHKSSFQKEKRLLGDVQKALAQCEIAASTSSLQRKCEGPTIECFLVDMLGREWPGPLLTFVVDKQEVQGIQLTVLRSMERWIGLLCERERFENK